jgi:rubredoxin
MSWNDYSDNHVCWACGRTDKRSYFYKWEGVPNERLMCHECGYKYADLIKKERDILAKLDKDSFKLFLFYMNRAKVLEETF